MTDPTTGRTFGERIQLVRERTGKSRPVVAALVGRSAEWLKAVEKGRRQPPRLDCSCGWPRCSACGTSPS